MRTTLRVETLAVAAVILAMCVSVFSSVAFAATPGPYGTQPSTSYPSATWHYTPPSAQWLALKNARRIRSGIRRGDRKETSSHPYVALTPFVVCCGGGGAPASYQLNIPTNVSAAFEPSDGTQPNYGPGTSVDDDAGKYYGSDIDFYRLCGPGAADITLWYWPNPTNLIDNYDVVDNAHKSTSTTWYSERMRGYMTYLAWNTQWPNWPHQGMMDNSVD